MKTRPSNTWWATTSRDELHHRQDALLRRFLSDRVVPFTKHYGELFKELGIEAGDIRGTDDLKLLPFTSKADLTTPRDFVIIPDEKALRHQWSTLRQALTHGPAATGSAPCPHMLPFVPVKLCMRQYASAVASLIHALNGPKPFAVVSPAKFARA